MASFPVDSLFVICTNFLSRSEENVVWTTKGAFVITVYIIWTDWKDKIFTGIGHQSTYELRRRESLTFV
jgi:hypothetical protein